MKKPVSEWLKTKAEEYFTELELFCLSYANIKERSEALKLQLTEVERVWYNADTDLLEISCFTSTIKVWMEIDFAGSLCFVCFQKVVNNMATEECAEMKKCFHWDSQVIFLTNVIHLEVVS